MKRGIFGVAIWLLVMAAPAFAAQKPKGGPKPQPVTTSAKSTAKVQAKSSVKPHAAPKSTKTTKTTLKTNTKLKTTSPAAKTTRTDVKAAKTAKTDAKAAKKTTTGSTQSTPIVTLSPVQQKLQRNTNLAAKLQSRLPPGTDLMAAAAGFKNLGQFVSTVNASHNHDLPFPLLKQRIVDEGMSLGQAMKDLR